MQKSFYTEEPDPIQYLLQHDGSAEVWLRTNIEEIETEEGTAWQADEVQFNTHLSQEEVLAQAGAYFAEEEPETTIDDLVEAIDILTGIILEG